MSFEVGIVGTVRASHVMPGRPPPEGELHAHDYRIEVVVERGALDHEGMVVDLDALRDGLERAIAEIRGADLNERLGIGEVTVERFAGWIHARIAEVVAGLRGATIKVRVWEAPDAFGGYVAPVR